MVIITYKQKRLLKHIELIFSTVTKMTTIVNGEYLKMFEYLNLTNSSFYAKRHNKNMHWRGIGAKMG